jgi:hypothetical protein
LLVVDRCYTTLTRYQNCRWCHECLDSKKHNHPNQEIKQFYHLYWQPIRGFDLNLRRWKTNDQG